jgi:hypothetical protein
LTRPLARFIFVYSLYTQSAPKQSHSQKCA